MVDLQPAYLELAARCGHAGALTAVVVEVPHPVQARAVQALGAHDHCPCDLHLERVEEASAAVSNLPPRPPRLAISYACTTVASREPRSLGAGLGVTLGYVSQALDTPIPTIVSGFGARCLAWEGPPPT